jgi:hypothetical protein
VSSAVPVEDAIRKGSVPAVPCRLKVTDEEVALIPNTVPLSSRVDVPRVVADNHLVAKPNTPPDTPAPPDIPRDDVDTQRVEVPVDQRS